MIILIVDLYIHKRYTEIMKQNVKSFEQFIKERLETSFDDIEDVEKNDVETEEFLRIYMYNMELLDSKEI